MDTTFLELPAVGLAADTTPEAPDEEEWVHLIDLRYRQYLAQLALQELFEKGELQALGG
jgi:hypothetical protein